MYGQVQSCTVWYGFDTLRYATATATLKKACGYSIETRNEYENKLINDIKKIKINTIQKEGDDAEERIEQCYKNLC